MTKTRTLTATFPNGEEITRTTARTYTHVVRAFVEGTQHSTPFLNWAEKPVLLRWCGRTDLMQKQVKSAQKYWEKEGVRIEVAEITNDPWAE